MLASLGVWLLVVVSAWGAPGADDARHDADLQLVAGLDTDAVDAFVEEQRRRHRIPGVGLAMIEGGRVTYTQGFGDAGDGRSMRGSTPAPAGALTETLTAILVLQLVEVGRVDLDEPVRTYLPDEPLPLGAWTVEELLQREGHVAEVGVGRVVPDPGYAVLARLVEAVTGREYAEVLENRVLRPLGMTSTRLAGDEAEAPARLAQGHGVLYGFPVARDAPFHLGEGGPDVISTAEDLARLTAAIGLNAEPHILGPSGLNAMRTPGEPGEDGYGMGWTASSHRGEPASGMDGLAPTYSVQVSALPEDDTGFALVVTADHLFDALVVTPQLRSGLLDLLSGRAAETTGPSMRTLGLVMLLMVVASIGLHAWSAYQLRTWRRRVRHLSRWQLTRAIGPHALLPFVVAALTWPAVRQLSGDDLSTLPAITWYLFPDVALLLLLAVVPDAVKAVYMTVVAVRGRRSRRPRWAKL
jgi:CubicO group peptidase (beta-lactamase class C family)